MAHPMGMLIKNFSGQPQLGMRIKGFNGMGMLVKNFDGYPRDGADFGSMGMRVEGYMGATPQMGDIFSDLLTNLETSLQKGATQATNQAIASTLKTVAADPTVQNAIVQSGNQAAINSLATQLKAGQAAVVANPWTSAAIVGGAGIALLLLFKAISK